MDIIYTARHLQHDPASIVIKEHPYESAEVPARVENIRAAVEAARLGSFSAPIDHGLEPILAVHDAGFVAFLQKAFERVSAYHGTPTPALPDTFATRLPAPRVTRGVWGQLGYYSFGIGSPIMAHTWEAAYWAAQCALTAADGLALTPGPSPVPPARETGVGGGGRGVRATYALCRPPGHHAARDLYGGFCYLNNAAIAARYLQGSPLPVGEGSGVRGNVLEFMGEGNKIALLDFDYHHGNGTQAIFYDDPSVLFCSLHADPEDEYPYFWGYADQRGEGAGEGFNRNFPLPLGTPDGPYLETLEEALEAIREFDPRCLVVSAGFDIFTGDPVGGFNVTTDGIAQVGRAIAALGLPTVIVQEGGYLLERLGENAVAFLEAFEAVSR